MSKVLIVFGSTGGNTQSVAERIEKLISEGGHEVTNKNVTEASKDELTNFDVILFGSSTWNDGELQDDFVPFQMDLESNPPALSGKKFAAFGCGESIYEKFCGAVDLLETSLANWGAQKIGEGLKIDGYPEEDDNVAKIEAWTKDIISKI